MSARARTPITRNHIGLMFAMEKQVIPGLTEYSRRVSNVKLKVGDIYKCPEGHEASIVWIKDDRRVIAVKCPQKHVSKVKNRKKIYDKNWVFLITI